MGGRQELVTQGLLNHCSPVPRGRESAPSWSCGSRVLTGGPPARPLPETWWRGEEGCGQSRTGSHLPRPVRSGWILRQCSRGQSPRTDGPAWPWSGHSKANLCLVISPPGRWIRWVLGIQETTRQTQTLPLGKADSRQVLGTSHSRQDSGC